MKFSTVLLSTLLSLLVASAPAPKVKVVYVTEYLTVQKTSGTAAPTLITPTPSTPSETLIDADNVAGDQKAAPAETTESKPEDKPEDKPEEKPEEKPEAPSPTSDAPAPTSEAPEPSSEAPKPSSDGGDKGHGKEYTGKATYYDPGMGACGHESSPDELIVALDLGVFNQKLKESGEVNPNKNPICGKKIEATHEGKSVVVTVVDACPGCGKNGLDLTKKAFAKIGDVDDGHFEVNWKWVDEE